MCFKGLLNYLCGKTETPFRRLTPDQIYRLNVRNYQLPKELAEENYEVILRRKIDIRELTREFAPNSREKIQFPEPKQWKEEMLHRLKYSMAERIGQGGHAVVNMCYTTDDNGYEQKSEGEELAIKVISLTKGKFGVQSKSRRDKGRLHAFRCELYALVTSRHQNIVDIKDHFIINNEAFIVMEFADHGSLQSYVTKNGPLSEDKAKELFGQMCSAIFFLHCKQGIAHLDIKLGNVLLTTDRTNKAKQVVKVSDFGLSRIRIDADTGVMKEYDWKGTVAYMSPQLLNLYIKDQLTETLLSDSIQPYNPFVADMWALGVSLFNLLHNDLPFKTYEDYRLCLNTLNDMKDKSYTHDFPANEKLSIECRDLLEDLLEPNPHKRLTIHNVVCHQWFDGKNLTDIETIKSNIC